MAVDQELKLIGTGWYRAIGVRVEDERECERSARRVAVVADHTKWNTVGLISFAALDEVDVLVTDAVPPADADAVADRVGELVITG